MENVYERNSHISVCSLTIRVDSWSFNGQSRVVFFSGCYRCHTEIGVKCVNICYYIQSYIQLTVIQYFMFLKVKSK